MGTRSLYSYLHGIMDGSKGMTRARNELSRNGDFMELYQQLENMFSDLNVTEGNGSLLFNTSLRADAKKPFVYSHPKLKKLEDVVIQHFKSWNKNGDQNTSNQIPGDTRIMIFSSFRDSVQEIAEMLNQHHPTVRVMTFVGHSSAGKGVKGFTQKEQLEVVKRFREGGFNTLVSTCVGEEGLDIGEVDLIICFDAQKSPIRLVQRMGRTGRKRQGRIVVILCQGREERTYNQSQSNKRSIYKAILGNNKMLHLNPQSPRMVPEGLNPKVHKMFITQGNYEAKESIRPKHKDRRSSTKHCNSSLFLNASADTLKEEWDLTHAEFETWNRLYRLQESDGIMDVRLPKSQFEYFRDAEPNKERPSGNIHKLSLTEWRVWQNRPFPTDSVDHSDRCKNFIHVMEMIELMRLEEGDCNYDLEMMSYLNKEDVDPTATNTRAINVLDNNSKVAEKSTHPKKGKTYKNTPLSLVLEPDEDFMSSCKKITKSHSTDFVAVDSKVHAQGTEEGGSTELERVVGLNEDDHGKESVFSANVTKYKDSRSNAVTSNQSDSDHMLLISDTEDAVAKSQSNVDAKADSGYHSFNEDPSSNLSNLFYTPQSFINHGVFTEFVDNKICELKKMLLHIKRFLSHSPPPINELDCLDDFQKYENFSHHSCLSDPVKDKTQEDLLLQPLTQQPLTPVPVTINSKEMQAELNHKKQTDRVAGTLLPATEVKKDDVLFGEDRLKPRDVIQTVGGKAACSEKNVGFYSEDSSKPSSSKDLHDVRTENDDHWDELFDYESQDKENENFTFQVNMPVLEGGDTEGSSAENENHNIDSVPTFLEDSFDLFEEDGFSDNANYGQLHSKHESTDKPHENAKTTVTFNMFDPSSLLQEQVQTEDEPETKDDIWSQENLEELDCSEELYSVNFDLGFSIEDDELSESDGKNETPSKDSKDDELSEIDSKNETPSKDSKDDNLSDSKNVTPSKDFKVPNPLKRNDMNAIGGNAVSTPVVSSNICSTFSEVAEKQIHLFSPLEPVRGKISLTPEKSLCSSSFFTPIGEKFRSPQTPLGNLCDSEAGELQSSKAGEKSIHSTTNFSVHDGRVVQAERRQTNSCSEHSLIESSPESEDDVVICRKRKLTKANVLMSPQTASSDCDFDSPIPTAKKRRHVLKTPDSDEEEEEDNFKSTHSTARDKSAGHSRKSYQHRAIAVSKKRKRCKQRARQFLDEEAELSSEGAEFVSSDEDMNSDNEQDTSLVEFLNDDPQLSQALNDSEMHGVYLKSVRSPAFGGRFKMAPQRRRHNMSVFSQIPEQDESYMEDSFCVQEEDDEEEADNLGSSEEEVEINFDLLKDVSIVGGKKQYCTRRRLKLKEAQSRQRNDTHPVKKKTRLIIQDDSSEEEETEAKSRLKDTSPPQKTLPSSKPSLGNTSCQNQSAPTLINNELDIPLRDRCQARINIKASISDELDFQPESKCSSGSKSRTLSEVVHSKGKEEVSIGRVNFDLTMDSSAVANLSFPGTVGVSALAGIRTLCILADSREISSGPEVISYLKMSLGVKVEVCSLGGCDYIVSSRLAVERKSQSEFANSANRSKLVDRIQHLQHLFDRVCLIIEKDRIKQGETSRTFQRTRYYDSTLSALISAGVQVLFSSSQEETAGLLKELGLLEQRKNTGIDVPTEVKGHKQEVMQFYLSIPNISYITALNLCQRFDSIRQMANSSVQVISARAHVSAQKAEELYRYVHYMFEAEMVASENPAKRSRVS
ncbi:hypothetical protein XENTR_v10021674 [Xenopus tropicalis]|nr:hypothetical protein XENTR_v10021674 [Xenopus tropicalis]